MVFYCGAGICYINTDTSVQKSALQKINNKERILWFSIMDLRAAALYLQVPSEECIDFFFFHGKKQSSSGKIYMSYIPFLYTFMNANHINIYFHFDVLYFVF